MTKAFKRLLLGLIVAVGSSGIGAAENYFLVSLPRQRDWALVYGSYVLPLSKQEDIDHARYLISLGRAINDGEGSQPLVVARVGAGKDDINRDYIDPRFPQWSWHVVEFLRFADVVADWLDGSPTQLENDPAWYMGLDVRQGIIGFGTVVRELGPVPLYVSTLPEGHNLQIYWSGVGTNYVYTLEWKESLASTNWLAVPGASWPLKTNQFSLPLTNAQARFYRVRVEAPTPADLSR
jgi:hypothetical protein